MKPANPYLACAKREFKRSLRRRSEFVLPVLFFILIGILFPLAAGPEANALTLNAAAIVWVALLLATLLSLDNIFKSELDDGCLPSFVMSNASLALLMMCKALCHWCLYVLPLIVCAIPLCGVLGVDDETLKVTILALLIGSPVLSLIGSAASALTMGLNSGGLLLALIILPLYIPVLIFGTAASYNASYALPATAELLFLGGLTVLAVTLAPLACAAAVRIRID